LLRILCGEILRQAIIVIAVVAAALAFLAAFFLLIDLDKDGLSNLEELSGGTNLLRADSDEDGLLDGAEVNVYSTNPLREDSDGDALSDGTEANGSWHLLEVKQLEGKEYDPSIYWDLNHKILSEDESQTRNSWGGRSWVWPYDYENIFIDNGIVHMFSNPLEPDSDGDGLNDGQEYEVCTNPKSRDTDNDGIDDRTEVNGQLTIPVFYDSDGDTLGDREEADRYRTNPLNWDCDNDHLSDGAEVKGYDADDDGTIDVDFPALGADPLIRDIFVEIDWMPGARSLGSYAREKLIAAFADHNIALHLDQGELGGGSETAERVERLYDRRPGVMNDFFDFMEKYFTLDRHGVFFWCLMPSGGTFIDGQQVGGFNYGDGFTVANTWPTDALLGSAFMHELGHGLFLSNDIFDGIDSMKYPFSEYMSVMNYNAPFFADGEFFDYSDGPPFDDWAHVNFGHLQGKYYDLSNR